MNSPIHQLSGWAAGFKPQPLVWTNSSLADLVLEPEDLVLEPEAHMPQEPLRFATFQNLVLVLLTFVLARMIGIAIYRLYFHPLAKFPGPKRVAVTKFFEFYHDVLNNNDFPEVVERLHDKYGPVVRIGPSEISINDRDFQLEYFTKDQNLAKDPWFYKFGFQNALFMTMDKAKHSERKRHVLHLLSMSGSYFQNLSAMFAEKVSNLGQRLEQTSERDGAINVSLAYRKMTNDVMREIMLGDTSWDSRDHGEDAETVHHPLFRSMSCLRHFNFLRVAHDLVPSFLYERWYPMAQFMREAETGIRRQVKNYENMTEEEKATYGGEQKPLLYSLIDGTNLYAEDNYQSAIEEFLELFWGGRESIGALLTTVSYYLLENPECMAKLHEELMNTNVDLSKANYGELRKLPYLNAVCKEGLRLSNGNLNRTPRINSSPVHYGGWVIPAGWVISAAPAFAHHNPEVYPEPYRFNPERWLSPGDKTEQDHYLRPFGYGSRACAGRTVAYEIIWRAVANTFSRYKFEFRGMDAQTALDGGALKVFPNPGAVGVTVGVEKYQC